MGIFWSLGLVQTPNFSWAEPIRIKQAFLIDSDVDLFMYLTQCIRFGSWKLQRLTQALLYFITMKASGILILACLKSLLSQGPSLLVNYYAIGTRGPYNSQH